MHPVIRVITISWKITYFFLQGILGAGGMGGVGKKPGGFGFLLNSLSQPFWNQNQIVWTSFRKSWWWKKEKGWRWRRRGLANTIIFIHCIQMHCIFKDVKIWLHFRLCWGIKQEISKLSPFPPKFPKEQEKEKKIVLQKYFW